MKAKVARFYGWGWREIDRMPYKIFYKYFLASIGLEAEEMLSSINISAFPDAKKEWKRNLINHLKRTAKKFRDTTGGRIKSYDEVIRGIVENLANGRR